MRMVPYSTSSLATGASREWMLVWGRAGRYRAVCICAVALASLFSMSGFTYAGSLTLECARADVFNPAWNTPLTFVFEGGDRGTLKVGGAFGNFAIPATRAPMQIQPGEAGEAIDGVAKTLVKLPSLTDLETCIDGTRIASSAESESDAFLNARDSCLRKLPAASTGVDAVAQIRIGLDGKSSGGEDAFVLFKLRYEAASRAPDGKMVVEAFPAQCKLKK
jgi:hypothetical protein